MKVDDEYAIKVDSIQPVRQFFPEFFGFNLEWVEFQDSLWDKKTGNINAQLFEWLRAFPGAVYRYPGGTNSNSFQWADTVGTVARRPSRKYVDWMDPFTADFGIDEYLKFVKEVDGQAWYVANLYGGLYSEADPQELAKQAGQLSQYLAQKQNEGFPGILRWELGNELDRGEYRWSPEKLAMTAKIVANKIHGNDDQAQFVSLLQEYSAQADIGISASQYNRRLAGGLKDQVSEYAIHLYYDGKPAGVPVPSELSAICSAIADAKKASPKIQPVMWLTEHGRVPPNAFETPDWKSDWPQTGDLEAAIGVADMVIAVSQIPEVRGAFIHSLHGGTGPWPLFHKNKSGELHPGAVYWALRILRDGMLENVLPTITAGSNHSDYEGGYDLRAVVMADAKHKKFSLWAINRNNKPVTARLTIDVVKNSKLTGKHIWISDNNIRANNYIDGNHIQPSEHPVELVFDKAGVTAVTLPPYSVSALTLNNPGS